MVEPLVHRYEYDDGQPQACSLHIERWPLMRGPDWRALPWRSRLAWRIRNFAARIDRRMVYAVTGYMPSGCTDQDLFEAIAFGAVASQRYLNDLHRDRMVESVLPGVDDAGA